MGKIMYTTKNEKGDINYVAAAVSFVSDGLGDAKDRVVNIGTSVDVYDPENKTRQKKYLNVGFWNNDDTSKAQLADRVHKAKVSPGSFLLLRTGTFRDAEPAGDGTPRMNASGFDFQYNSQVEIPVEGKAPVNIICGTARRTQLRDDGTFVANVPIDSKVDGNKVTTWYSISFKDKGKNNLGTRASKTIRDGVPVCILAGKITDNDGTNGMVYHNAYAFDFFAGFAKNQET